MRNLFGAEKRTLTGRYPDRAEQVVSRTHRQEREFGQICTSFGLRPAEQERMPPSPDEKHITPISVWTSADANYTAVIFYCSPYSRLEKIVYNNLLADLGGIVPGYNLLDSELETPLLVKGRGVIDAEALQARFQFLEKNYGNGPSQELQEFITRQQANDFTLNVLRDGRWYLSRNDGNDTVRIISLDNRTLLDPSKIAERVYGVSMRREIGGNGEHGLLQMPLATFERMLMANGNKLEGFKVSVRSSPQMAPQ
jgi:hypothetical protein